MTAGRFRLLRLDRVGRRFGTHDAVRDLDLSIEQGEFIALLGPSGCGKSTALNCIAGLLPLTSGSIWMDDRRIDTLPPERRNFGMVFQSYALFPHMSVARNVAFGLKMRRVPRAEIARRVSDALRLVQLDAYADRLPGQLSGGQQQRVAIARAIVFEPTLVLMDEPLSNLDAKLRLEMRTEIRRLHQELRLTTIYVTHDQEEALSLADRLVVLRDGVVQQIGSAEDLYTRPANLYVAGFMGYRNVLPATLVNEREGYVRVRGAGTEFEGTAPQRIGGQRVVATFRPEDAVIESPSDEGIVARIQVVEYHGREYAIQGQTKDGEMIHIRTAQRLKVGDEVRLSIPSDRVLVFPAVDSATVRPTGPYLVRPPSVHDDRESPAPSMTPDEARHEIEVNGETTDSPHGLR